MTHRPSAALLALAAALLVRPAFALGDRVEATCSAATGGDITGSTVSIVCGVPPGQLEALVRDRTKPLEDLAQSQKDLLGHLRDQLDLNQAQLQAALKAAGEAEVPPGQLADRLVEIAARYRELLHQVEAGTGDGPEAARLRAAARDALGRGDLESADSLLGQLNDVRDADVERAALEAAAVAARRAGVALTRLRYLEAAGDFTAAAERVPPGHDGQRLAYLDDAADALYRQGVEQGDNQALVLAAERYRDLQRELPRERDPRPGPPSRTTSARFCSSSASARGTRPACARPPTPSAKPWPSAPATATRRPGPPRRTAWARPWRRSASARPEPPALSRPSRRSGQRSPSDPATATRRAGPRPRPTSARPCASSPTGPATSPRSSRPPTPSARPWPSVPATATRKLGPPRRTASATPSCSSASVTRIPPSSTRPSRPSRRRCSSGRASAPRSTGRPPRTISAWR